MGDKSLIEWTDATWNPVTGCTKVSQGCKHCYAERLFPRPYPGRQFTDVRTHPERLDQPLRWKKPRRIFVNSMSDLFHEDVPDLFIDQVFETMIEASRHVFQILTKRHDRMRAFLSVRKWPRAVTIDKKPLPNLWLGVSVEDQATADERIPLLLQTPATVRFVSYEPALGPVDFRVHLNGHCPEHDFASGFCVQRYHAGVQHIHQIIAGGESGPNARPAHPNWFRSARDQCASAGVAFFFKQWGEWASLSEVEGPGPHHYFPDGAVVRRVGKKAAGRTLDGRTHDEYPVKASI